MQVQVHVRCGAVPPIYEIFIAVGLSGGLAALRLDLFDLLLSPDNALSSQNPQEGTVFNFNFCNSREIGLTRLFRAIVQLFITALILIHQTNLP